MKRPVNLSEAARGMPGPSSEAAVNRRRVRLGADLAAAARTATPYGAVGIEIRIGDIAVPIINPFALLWLLCTQTTHYFACLRHCVAAGPARVVLYVDEATPGNQLRPDRARSYYAIYWSIAEYPDWCRSRHGGWHDLCQTKVSTVEDIPGGISAVTSKVLELFWSPDPNELNFERLGVLLDPPAVAGPANAHAPAAAGPALGVAPRCG